MATDKDGKVPTSSVVIRALDAKTFSELESFVKDLEGRPTERLLRDLPELMTLSEGKVSIITNALATRFRHGNEEERRAIRHGVSAAFELLAPGEGRDRVFGILKRLSPAK